MGRLFVESLEGRIYSCKHCRTHIALYDDIVSKSFHCRHGKAYLFKKFFLILGLGHLLIHVKSGANSMLDQREILSKPQDAV
ncbi:LOW QUALITY PROTEIN: hypothetical protein NC652_026339 [Populus alba x Populus x berolinensis]|nr:LOW QUALITY PROTEIN: hypothetical protein NC652_026339 [Populus alba x Populus x berolinensis]